MHINESDDILSAMGFLDQQIKGIDNYPDKSLFFQDPRVIEGWIVLVRAIKQIENCITAEEDTDWEQRSELYVVSLLARRELFLKFRTLYRAYYDPLKKMWDGYSGWLDGDCISAEGIEALKADRFEQVLAVDDINQYLEELNLKSLDSRYAVYKTLTYIFEILQALMNRGGQVVIDMNPSDEDFANAIDDDLREWTRHYEKEFFKRMKEDLLRHFKTRLTDENKYERWCEMLRADEKALREAMTGELAICNDDMQKHWGDDFKKQMDENGELMRLIYSSCFTEELIDIWSAERVQPLIELLTPDNLTMFYEIIVRRNIIQCEMYPELKTQHEEWLKGHKEKQPGGDEASRLDHERRSKLDDIIQILQNGNWKLPATSENIVILLNAIFGKDQSFLEEADIPTCDNMWALIESGRGDRKLIVSANLAGFFADENLLTGSSSEISNDLFGNNSMVNNVTDGKKNNRSYAFEAIIPFLTKYTNKIIRGE